MHRIRTDVTEGTSAITYKYTQIHTLAHPYSRTQGANRHCVCMNIKEKKTNLSQWEKAPSKIRYIVLDWFFKLDDKLWYIGSRCHSQNVSVCVWLCAIENDRLSESWQHPNKWIVCWVWMLYLVYYICNKTATSLSRRCEKKVYHLFPSSGTHPRLVSLKSQYTIEYNAEQPVKSIW